MKKSAPLLLSCLFAVLASGCVGPAGGGYETAGYGTYYEQPYGAYYGGWSPGYYVAPPVVVERVHDDRFHGRPGPSPRAFHAPPASHPIPSIPSQPRGGPPHPGGHPPPHEEQRR